MGASDKRGFPGWLLNASIAAGIAIVTYLLFRDSLQNQFTNWDDQAYVLDNKLIKDWSWEGMKSIFTTPVASIYHPLTILSYTLDYHRAQLDPQAYHTTSLLLHMLTVAAVYSFATKLSGSKVAGAVTALLFAIHPMHVESVAWVSGRKDVLFSLFYVLSCIAWLFYSDEDSSRKRLWYAVLFLLYTLSLLSKPTAIILPFSLLLIDYYKGRLFGDYNAGSVSLRSIKWKVVIEKVPLLLLSVCFGLRAVYDQANMNTISIKSVSFNFIDRLALGSYALATYIWKAVVPINLSCVYTYPSAGDEHTLPVHYYAFLLILPAFLLVLWFLRKNRVIVFGTLFFLFNIAILLQFVPVGISIVSERYSYLPYLGLFFIAGVYFVRWIEKGGGLRYATVLVGTGCCFLLGFTTHERNKVWYDGVSLWRDQVSKESDISFSGYTNLAGLYVGKLNATYDSSARVVYYDSAISLLKNAIALRATAASAYTLLGELYRNSGNYQQARLCYYTVLGFDAGDDKAHAYQGLGIVYNLTGRYDSANYCFKSATELDPGNANIHSDYGNFLEHRDQLDAALKQFDMAIHLNPDLIYPHYNKGLALQRRGRSSEALADFEAAIALAPANGELYFARSVCRWDMGDKQSARADLEKAISLGFNKINPDYYNAVTH